MTMTLISTVTVGSGGAASIDFTSIPQTYTDLFVVVSARCTTTQTDILGKFNGSTSGYSGRYLVGTGSSAVSGTVTNFMAITVDSASTSNTFSNSSLYIPNYTGSTAKSYSVDAVNENNATGAYSILVAGLWTGTAAINQITLTPASGNHAQYSSASLYGILKGSGGATVS